MILEFFRFELREQLRSPLLWLMAALFALLAFGAASSDAVQIGGGIGNVHRNAPTVIATWLSMFTLIGMLLTTMFVTGALLRDFDQGTAELIFASPVRRRDYLAGRLAAALAACLLVYLLIGVGMFVAQFMPWIDPERLSPVAAAPWLWAYAVMVLPNVLFTGALLALLAAVTRSVLWVYIGVLAFFVLYGVSAALMRDLDNVWVAVLSEPLGLRALSRTIRYWPADERNVSLPAFTGYLLANRAVWFAVSLGLLAATFALFRTERAGTGRRRGGAKSAVAAPVAAVARPALAVPRVVPRHDAATAWRQFLGQVRFDTLGVFRSVPFLVMLGFGVLNFIPSALLDATAYGTGIHPVTSQMVQSLRGSYSFLLAIIVMFYAGELVWKERAARIDEVGDAMPVPDWVPLLGKFVALLAVIASFQAIGALAAMAIQLGKGHTALEPLLYLKLLAVDSVIYVLMGGLALALQVFANNKFVGYGLLLLVLVGQSVLGMLDLTSNLYNFGSWPNAPFSDMNGYGHFLAAQLWFQAYWGVFLVAMGVLSAALWVRGTGASHRQRLGLARRRLRGPLGATLAAAALAFVALGGFLFWNTNVRNEFRSPDQERDLQARYEREMKKYAGLPQPKITAVDTDVDLWPETQSLRVQGVYQVHNPHAQPITEIHVSMEDDRMLRSIDLGEAELTFHEPDFGHRIYRLAEPIAPGGRREVRFTLEHGPDGITAGAPDTRIVDNGSFFNNQMFPTFGYQPRVELQDRNERRKRDLGEPRRMPTLEDQAARADNYVTPDADWIDFATTVCTAPDQVALAPGYLQREFTRDGRRCFRYEMDRPMLNFFAYLSARWEVRRGEHDGIPIEIYHHPDHAWNVDRMIEATQKSLAYYQSQFTPYQHRQVRILEFPGYQGFAQSFANTIPYSESVGFIADLSDPEAIDYVFYITAHEIAHQWWAHQVIGANMQGATVLSESLSQYFALMVMEKEYGRQKMRRFLKYELDSYLSDRGGELVEELPLYRVEDQQYIHYNKGSLVFYRLREEMGETALNRALRRFLQDKGYQQPPYTTSVELIDYLRAEATPAQQPLITELFERIGFHDNRVEEATARRLDDGRYEVTLRLLAGKRHADGLGKETVVPVDDWIEIGLFARGASGSEADERPLYLQRHRITEEHPTLTLVVDELPYEAGFDPYNKLIDRVSSDNRRRVTLQ